MQKPIKILIIGNGFGGTYALKSLHKFFHKDPNVELSLVGEKNYFLFTPLLHEVATGGIHPENIIEPIRNILKCCLRNFYLGKAEMINLKDRIVKVGDILVPYDYLVLAPGSEANFYNIPGAEENSFSLKSIDDAIKIKNHLIKQMETASHITDSSVRNKKLSFVIVGGGPTGVELAAELQELIRDSFSRYYRQAVIEDTSVFLIEGGPELMMQFNPKMRQKSLAILKKKKVTVMLNTLVKEATSENIFLANQTCIGTETVIWAAGIKPATLIFDQEPTKTKDGRLLVNEYLALEEHPEIFAIGDTSAFKQKEAFLPALGQVAEKEAKSVAENIAFLIRKKKQKPFYYHHSGNMVSLGQWMAVGEIFNFNFSGRIAWWIWRTIYLSKLISWSKKIKVALDWTFNIFIPRDISQL